LSAPSSGLHQGAHIVVADEKPALLDMMVRTLRAADHCVFQAYDGLAAFELALALRNIDLLVTNTRLPGLNGPQLIRRVREELPKLPILYIKNHDHPHDKIPDGLPANVPTLAEPFTAEQLLEAVRPLLDRT
jgi:DNA-binding response OmpR family regulator